MIKVEELVLLIETNKTLQVWIREKVLALSDMHNNYWHITPYETKFEKDSLWFIEADPSLASIYDIHGPYWNFYE